jgi:hypothetical protein
VGLVWLIDCALTKKNGIYGCFFSFFFQFLPPYQGVATHSLGTDMYTVPTARVYSFKVKVKQSLYTPWRRLGERMYSSYSFTTSALDGGEWSASRPGRALPPGKGPPVPIVQEAGWAPEPVWTQRLEEKSFAPAGDRTQITRSSSP